MAIMVGTVAGMVLEKELRALGRERETEKDRKTETQRETES